MVTRQTIQQELSYFSPLLSIEKNKGSNEPETPKQYNLKNHSGKLIENKTEKLFFKKVLKTTSTIIK